MNNGCAGGGISILSQRGTPLTWGVHGYDEVALDVETLTLGP
jgi:hypothetical protein